MDAERRAARRSAQVVTMLLALSKWEVADASARELADATAMTLRDVTIALGRAHREGWVMQSRSRRSAAENPAGTGAQSARWKITLLGRDIVRRST